MRFSQRIGAAPANMAAQIETMDANLRGGLWEVVEDHLLASIYHEWAGHRMSRRPFGAYHTFVGNLWAGPLRQEPGTLPRRYPQFKEKLHAWFFSQAAWYEVYDFFEHILRADIPADVSQLRQAANAVLDREQSAYRLVRTQVITIMDPDEVTLTQRDAPLSVGLEKVQSHLTASGDALAMDDAPGAANEATTALAMLCRHIIGDEQLGLTDLTTALSEVVQLHPAQRMSLSAVFDSPTPTTITDARFVLALVTDLINTLIVKAQQHNIDL